MTAAVEPHTHNHTHTHKPSRLEHKIAVSIPPAPINEEVNKRIQKLAKTAKIDGFRPGKTPLDVIKKRFEDSIEIDVLNELIKKYRDESIQKENLIPATVPQIEFDGQYESGKPFAFTVIVEVFPEIILQSFSDLIIEKTSAQVTDDDVQLTLENMQKQQAQWKEISGPAKENDKIWIKCVGTLEGEDMPFPGGSHDNMPVIVGSQSMIPGFEENLLGAQIHQDLTISVNFPAQYGDKNLAGKPAKFLISINKIEEPILPPLDDEFARKFGESGAGHSLEEVTLVKLKEEISKTLKKQAELNLHRKLKTEVMHKLYEAYKNIEVPHSLIHQEAQALLEQTKKQFSQLKAPNLPAFTPEMFEDKAQERIVVGLVMREIIKQRNLKPDASKIRELIEQEAQRFNEPEKIVHYYYNDSNRLQQMESLALEEQVLEGILAEATIVEKQAKISEVLEAFQK